LTTIVVRTATDPRSLTASIRQALHTLDPNQPIRSVTTFTELMSASVARDRFFTLLFAGFGGLGLLLAAIGVYGITAYSMGRRTQEIGVCMALGAQPGDILRSVVRGGMRPVLKGVVIGVLGSLILSRLLRQQLYGIAATDPLSYVMAAAVLTVAALIACYIPARRALRIDPVVAIHTE
jgi:ABC-type antimicrobial peptide transport system permease subunit